MNATGDPGLRGVLQHLGVTADAALGHGGEAWVYALDAERVVRVLHPGGREDDIRKRQALVDELAQAPAEFALPSVLEIGEIDGRVFAIERRLRGHSLMDELRTSDGTNRRRLIEAHLDTAAALGDLRLEPRTGFGDLIADTPISTSTWRDYLQQRAAANLARATPEFHTVDAIALAAPFEEPHAATFVHLDAFVGNMLTDGQRITAVIDIGVTSVVGDRRFDSLAAVVYLLSGVSIMATPEDSDVAMSWLRNAGLEPWFEPARHWLAAYWSFATDDEPLFRWCRSVLAN